MKLWVLGSGVPTPSETRVCSGYLVEVDGKYIVFDHGFGAFSRLLQLGIKLGDINHLFFSHLHYDHMGDYSRLVLTRWDQSAGLVGDLKVFGPPPLKNITARLFGEDSVFSPDLNARTGNQSSLDLFKLRGGEGKRAKPYPVVTELASEDHVSGPSWSLETTEVHHAAPHLTCFAYKLVHNGKSFIYSGDTGPNENLVALAQDSDVLVHMCHYITGTERSDEFTRSCTGHIEVAEIARKANVRTLVLTHITNQIDRPGVREKVIAEISAIYSGTVILAEDLMQIPFEIDFKSHVD